MSRTIGGSNTPTPPIDANGLGEGGVGFGNSGPPTRIPRQIIGGNADELQKWTENEGRMLGELVSPNKLPLIPPPIGPRDRWRGGVGGVPSRGTASRGRIPHSKDLPNVEALGGRPPPKVCNFGRSPSPPIGKLADKRAGMAPDRQSAAVRSDRRRLRIRDHPRTRDDLPRPLDGPNARKDAPPSRGARSCAGSAMIGLNGR